MNLNATRLHARQKIVGNSKCINSRAHGRYQLRGDVCALLFFVEGGPPLFSVGQEGSGALSLSPRAGHNKACGSDFRNQRFEHDTGKMQKMRKAPLTLQKQGSEETPHSKNAEKVDIADTKTRKTADWL